MQLSDIVYKVLVRDHLALTPLEVADIVQMPCQNQRFQKMLGEEPDKPPTGQQLALQETAAVFRSTFFPKYMKGVFKEAYVPAQPVHYGSCEVRYEGVLQGSNGETPIFLEMVASRQFKTGEIPDWMFPLIAARTYLLTRGDQAMVVLMDQNTQAWAAWIVSGDFKVVGELVASEINRLEDAVITDQQPIGSPSACATCIYTKFCEAEKVDEIHPFPTVPYRVVFDSQPIKALDDYLWSLNNENTGRATHVIHPSELTIMECDRAIAYGLMGTPEKPKIDPKLRRIFDVGHCVHDVIQSSLVYDLRDACVCEVRIHHEDLKIKGSADIVIANDIGEIKSIGAKGYDSLKDPKKEHEDQATIYATAPQTSKDFVTYLYFNKDTGDIKEIRKKVDRRRWHRLATRASTIVRAVAENMMPGQISKDHVCAGCKFQWTCKPDFTKKGYRR